MTTAVIESPTSSAETTNSGAKPGRHKRGTHPASLANLKPAWSRATAPRTGGRPTRADGTPRTVSVLAHLRHIATCDYTTDELRAQATVAGNTHNRRIAARLYLDATHGEPEVRRRALETLLDRTEGKPVQVQHVLTVDVTDPTTLLARAREEARAAVVGADMPAALVESGSATPGTPDADAPLHSGTGPLQGALTHVDVVVNIGGSRRADPGSACVVVLSSLLTGEKLSESRCVDRAGGEISDRS